LFSLTSYVGNKLPGGSCGGAGGSCAGAPDGSCGGAHTPQVGAVEGRIDLR